MNGFVAFGMVSKGGMDEPSRWTLAVFAIPMLLMSAALAVSFCVSSGAPAHSRHFAPCGYKMRSLCFVDGTATAR